MDDDWCVSCVILETTIWVHVAVDIGYRTTESVVVDCPYIDAAAFVNRRHSTAVRTERIYPRKRSTHRHHRVFCWTTMDKCKIRTSTHMSNARVCSRTHAFCIILEMNSTSIGQWSAYRRFHAVSNLHSSVNHSLNIFLSFSLHRFANGVECTPPDSRAQMHSPQNKNENRNRMIVLSHVPYGATPAATELSQCVCDSKSAEA